MVIFLKNSDFTGQAVLRRVHDLPEPVRAVLRHVAYFICGMLFASASNLSAVSPFGVAFCAAAENKYILSAGLGAAAGYILTQDSISSLRLIAASVCAGVLARVMREFEKVRNGRLLPSCIAFLSCFLSGMAVLFANGLTGETFLLYLGEGVTAFAAAYFFSTAQYVLENGKPVRGVTLEEASAVLGSGFLIMCSLSGLTVLEVSPARMIMVFGVLFFAAIYKEAGGAVGGMLAFLLIAISSDTGAVSASFAVGGLLAGAFSRLGRRAVPPAFFASFLTAYMFSGGGSEKYFLLIEAALPCAVFMFLPNSLFIKAEGFLLPKDSAANASAENGEVRRRIHAARTAVDDIERSVSAVSKRLSEMESCAGEKLMLEVQSSVCCGCGRYDFCWEQNFKETRNALDEMYETLKKGGVMSRDKLPSPFSNRCIRQTSFAETYSRLFFGVVFSEAADKKTDEVRLVTADQFGGISDMLRDLENEFNGDVSFDTKTAERIRKKVRDRFCCDTDFVSCLRDKNGRMFCEITFSEVPSSLNIGELRDAVGETCDREFELPVIKGDRSVRLCEKTAYSVESACSQIPADNEKLCGDTFESFYDGMGNYVVILSDGMGTGPRAALDSAMASGLMARLVKAGFGFQSALRLVNSSLLLKSRDESLATLDIVKIDLYTGKAVFYKAGAAPSVIRRQNGKLLEIKKAALPAGILRDATFSSCEGQLENGDTVIIASDGAYEYAHNAVKEELQSGGAKRASTKAKNISLRAKKAKGKARCDDITVIALNISGRARREQKI